MNKTINDLVKESKESGLACVPPSEWVWSDCDIEGHAESLCYMATCPACGTIDRDCEYA